MSNLQITAAELNLTAVFKEMIYMIPVYQRPYSWDTDLCEQLWDDLTEFMESIDKSVAYFLGTIIVTSEDDNSLDEDLKLYGSAFSVIDGQQRLTTLSILMKALYEKDNKNSKLKGCLYNVDARDEDKILSTRIISNVNNSTEALHFMSLFDKTEYGEKLKKTKLFKNDRYNTNYNFFKDKIAGLTLDETHEFVDIVLSKVTLLKVSVPKREDALIIFKTINDRGKDLDEADILKAEIFNKANKKDEGEDFIEYWGNIFKRVDDLKSNDNYNTLKDFNMPTLFRTYMYIKRGMNGDVTKEIKLLDFFKGKIYKGSNNEKNNLANMEWKDIMSDLDRICGAIEYVVNKQNKISFLYKIISYYPNSYPHYISILYLFHRIKKADSDNSWHVEKKDEANCEDFFEKLIAYVYTVLILNPGVNYLKEVAHKIMIHISNISNNDVKHPDIKQYSKIDFDNLKSYLNDTISNKVIRGYLMLLVYLNPKSKDYKSILKAKKIDVEHILPKSWHDNWYDEWNKDKFDNAINKIGNLLILDRERNIKASNLWFGKKKEIYKEADFTTGEIIDLINIPTNTWSEKQFIERQEKSVMALMSFFRDRNKSSNTK